MTALLYLTIGLGGGAFYACLGVSASLIHRGSSVTNLAIGPMASIPALTYVVLRRDGDLVLPLVGLPSRFHVADELHGLVAALIAVSVGVIVFLVAHLVVFHPLRGAPAVTKAVASLGVALLVQGIAQERHGLRPLQAPGQLTERIVSVFGGRVPLDRPLAAAVAVLLTVGCVVFLRYARSGLVLRAAAENDRGLVQLGYAPVRSAATAWLLAGLLTSVGAVLLATFTSVTVTQFTLWTLPALGAALAGRFRRLGVVCAVGLAIGALQSYAVHLGAVEVLPRVLQHGLDDALPLVAIVVALSLSGRTLPRRGALLERRHPEAAPAPSHPQWMLLGAAGLLVAWFGSSGLRLSLAQTAIAAVLALSMVVSAGFIGQVTLAQLTVSGLAAFMLAGLTAGLPVPFPLAPLLAVIGAAALGFIAGVPALRVRGAQLIVVSMAFAVAINRLVLENPEIAGFDYTVEVPPARFLGVDLGVFGHGGYPAPRTLVVVVLAALAGFVAVSNLRRSATGRRWLAVRGNETAAAAAGVDVVRAKLVASAVSMGLAGLGGVLIAYTTESVSYRLFEIDFALGLLALTYLAGIASLNGALVAGVLAAGGLAEHLVGIGAGTQARSLYYGLALVIVTVRLPAGLAGSIRRLPLRAPWVRSSAAALPAPAAAD